MQPGSYLLEEPEDRRVLLDKAEEILPLSFSQILDLSDNAVSTLAEESNSDI